MQYSDWSIVLKKLAKIVRRSFRHSGLSYFEFVMKNRVKLCIQMNKIQKNRVKFAPVCMCDDLKQELKQAYHCIIFLVINLCPNSLYKPYLYVMNTISIFFISTLLFFLHFFEVTKFRTKTLLKDTRLSS